MKWFRVELKNKSIGYMSDGTLLVTDQPKVIWDAWYGCEECDVYEVEGIIIEERTEVHEFADGREMEIQAPRLKVTSIKKIGTWKV